MSEAQLDLQPKPKREVDLDGRVDEKRNIHYLAPQPRCSTARGVVSLTSTVTYVSFKWH